MFWAIFLCHLIADYPLQTDAMVKAKKKLPGLMMHVSVHFLTMLVVLCGILEYDPWTGSILAATVAAFHLGIDHWKNILTGLKPDWVIFIYVQDQLLHILSILLVTWVWKTFEVNNSINVGDSVLVYATGFVLVTHVWFVTERVFTYRRPAYQQWVTDMMWPRMMSRAVFYSLVTIGVSFWVIPVLAGGVIVGWNDLDLKVRSRTIVKDLAGVLLFIALMAWIAS